MKYSGRGGLKYFGNKEQFLASDKQMSPQENAASINLR